VNRTQVFARILIGILGVFLCAYLADFAYLRVRMIRAKANGPFETLTRTRVLAIPQKSGKFDYEIDQQMPVETLTCVHSLFPHYGDQPCWYLKPRLNQPIPVS